MFPRRRAILNVNNEISETWRQHFILGVDLHELELYPIADTFTTGKSLVRSEVCNDTQWAVVSKFLHLVTLIEALAP